MRATDLLRAAFVVAAVTLASLGHISYVNLVVSTVAVVASRFLDLPWPYDLAFIVAMALTGWGDALSLYDAVNFYDKVVHIIVPLAVSPIVYILLARGEVVPHLSERNRERHHYVGIFVVTLALAAAVGAFWEVFEYLSDHLLGSHLQAGQTDTITDLVADSCWAAAGGALLVVWSIYGWASERAGQACLKTPRPGPPRPGPGPGQVRKRNVRGQALDMSVRVGWRRSPAAGR
jgi:hypothetical protein